MRIHGSDGPTARPSDSFELLNLFRFHKRHHSRSIPINTNETLVNGQIRVPTVRVIAADGSNIGVMPIGAARSKAQEAGLDLVLVSPDGKPPVCKIMDFSKHKYEESKKKRENKTKAQQTKEVRLSPKIGDHDLETKLRNAVGFLQKGMKVLLVVQYRGREMAHQEEGRRVMEDALTRLSGQGTAEDRPKMNGKRLSCTLKPVTESQEG